MVTLQQVNKATLILKLAEMYGEACLQDFTIVALGTDLFASVFDDDFNPSTHIYQVRQGDVYLLEEYDCLLGDILELKCKK